MPTNGKNLNELVRLEIDASDLTNLVANHSAQTGNTTGWEADTGITLEAALNPTRTVVRYGSTVTDSIYGAYGSSSNQRTIRATYASTAAATAEVRSPSFAVVPGRYIGFSVSLADSKLAASPYLNIRIGLRFYNGSGTLISSTADSTTVFSPSDRYEDLTRAVWQMREANTATVDGLVPTGAVTARARLTFVDVANSGGVSTDTKINRAVYISELMVVTSTSQQSVSSVPFSDTAVWQNILGSSQSITISRGGDVSGVVDEIEPGQMTAVIYDAALDPARNVRARYGRKVRVTYTNSLVDAFRPLFTGRITSLDVDYASTKGQKATTYRPRITITANDAVTELRQISAPYNYDGGFGDKVLALMSASTVPRLVSPPATASTNKTSLTQDASLWDQLVLARDSHASPASKLFVDKDGSLNALGTDYKRSDFAFAAKTGSQKIWNNVRNPSFEIATYLGAITNGTAVRSTDWAASGKYSLKLASTATSGGVAWTASQDAASGSLGTYEYNSATVTVKAIAACRVRLTMTHTDGTTATAFVDFAAGDIQRVTISPFSGFRTLLGYTLKVTITQPGTDTAWASVADLVYLDRVACMKAGPFNPGDLYLDGDAGFVFPNSVALVTDRADMATEWGSYPHEGYSFASVGSRLSYLAYTATTGTKSIVNSLVINRRNVGEMGNERAYGPYLNQDSVVTWGTAGAEITVVDGDPAALSAVYLAKYQSPNIIVSSITVNPTMRYLWDEQSIGADFNGVASLELYNAITFQNDVSKIYGKYYVIGIEHEITPDDWQMVMRLRPVDQVFAVAVSNASGGLTAGPLDVIGPNGRAQEMAGGINLNNFIAPGDYAQTQNTEAASGLNYPVPQAGLLKVSMNQDQTMIWQEYTVYKNGAITEGTKWIRTFFAGAWSAWKASVSPAAYGLARLNAAVSLATSGAWTTISAWTTEETVGLTYASGAWTTQAAGLYRVHFTVSFANNATGVRGVRPVVNGVAQLNVLSNPTTGFQTTVDVSILIRLAVGATIGCQAYQNSGAALNMLGDTGGMFTKTDIAKIGD